MMFQEDQRSWFTLQCAKLVVCDTFELATIGLALATALTVFSSRTLTVHTVLFTFKKPGSMTHPRLRLPESPQAAPRILSANGTHDQLATKHLVTVFKLVEIPCQTKYCMLHVVLIYGKNNCQTR